MERYKENGGKGQGATQTAGGKKGRRAESEGERRGKGVQTSVKHQQWRLTKKIPMEASITAPLIPPPSDFQSLLQGFAPRSLLLSPSFTPLNPPHPTATPTSSIHLSIQASIHPSVRPASKTTPTLQCLPSLVILNPNNLLIYASIHQNTTEQSCIIYGIRSRRIDGTIKIHIFAFLQDTTTREQLMNW